MLFGQMVAVVEIEIKSKVLQKHLVVEGQHDSLLASKVVVGCSECLFGMIGRIEAVVGDVDIGWEGGNWEVDTGMVIVEIVG